MKTYILLLNHAPDRYKDVPEDEMMAIISDYVAWSQKLAEDGVYAGGDKLVDAPGKLLKRVNGSIEVHDTPMAEITELLGGTVLVKAKDYDGAVAIAQSCPHLVHNSSLEIREIDELD